MIATAILTVFNSFGLVVFLLGLQGIAFIPLTLVYEMWKSRTLRIIPPFAGRVTVLIPAYNEERTIRNTVSSVLASDYRDLEVIVINDGSTDGTEAAIEDYVSDGRVRYIAKPNGGKASALNAGIEAATGEAVIFTDADSMFLHDTVGKMVRWFGDPSIHAVCGNDKPLHPTTAIQKFLAVTTHIGTGFVRRALSVMRSIPIITGNLGAVRTSVLREIKGFKEIWGEDLELTFRLYLNRKRVIFDPEPKVVAECPSTIGGLWKQRIRWVRSYLKIAFLHKELFFNPRYWPFSFYLPVNFLNMAIVPILQMALVVIIPWAYATERLYFTDTVEVLAFLGDIFFLVIAVYSIILDKDYKDLIYLPHGFLIIPLSYFYNVVAVYSWWKEIGRAEERWEKVERRKVFYARRARWEAVLLAIFIAALSSGGTYYYLAHVKVAPKAVAAFDLAVSTHFDAWGDWRKTVSNVMGRRDVGLSSLVGVSAGRPEWAYFKWKGREEDWSNHQKGAKEDMLESAAERFKKQGFKVAAFIDIYGPKYIRDNPGAAAVSFDGSVHSEQVSFMELVEGRYGTKILMMVEYIAANYPDVDIINLTEMPYYTYSYNVGDLMSYESFTGRKGWPRDASGNVDRSDQSIWEWRSTLMERFIEKAASAAHRHGKRLYVDVPVSWQDFTYNGRESGLDYERVLRHADNIVVWNYFFLERRPPEVSEALARYLSARFPAGSFYVSLGLWGNGTEVMDAASLARGVQSTLKGGVKRIWITPDSLVTDTHWDGVRQLLVKTP